jgi:hypothetical protein
MNQEQLAAMERHIALMVEQRLAQQQQIIAVAQAAPVAVAPADRSPRGKLHENARYGGSAVLEPWLATMEQYADYYGIVVDDRRVAYAVAHFKDAALQWWRALPQEGRPATWTAFTQLLHTRFQPVTSTEMARAKLRTLTQGRGSVQAYTAAFNALLVYLPVMDEGDRVFAYIQGLNDRVQAHVDEVAHSSLESAIERAMRFSSRINRTTAAPGGAPASAPMELDAMGLGNLSAESDCNDVPTHSTASSSAAAPITRDELHAIIAAALSGRQNNSGGRGKGQSNPSARPRGPPVIPHLSPQQVKSYMDAGRCFGCGSNEHRARQCPKRVVGADGRPSWSN